MPRVPEYRSNVQAAGVPGARFRENSNIESFGGGRANQIPSAVEKMGAEITKIQEEANQAVLNEANEKLIRGVNRLAIDPQEGFGFRQGKASFGIQKEYGEKFDKLSQEIEASLQNDTQRARFAETREKRRTSFDYDVQRHIFGESQKVMDQSEKSAAETYRQDAVLNYRNNEIRDMALANEEQVIKQMATRHGWDADTTNLQLRLAKSNTHEAILSRAIATGDEAFAKEYFLKHRESLVGPSRNGIEKAMEEMNLRGESMRGADQIVASSPDWASALAKTKGIEDPKLRDETVRRVNDFYSNQDRAKKQRLEDQYLSSVNLIEANPGKAAKDIVPATTWSQLSIAQREALEKRAVAPTQNDDKAWLDFLEKPASEVANMSRSEFESYWVKFDAGRRSKAEAQWEAAKAAQLKGEGGSKAQAYLTQTMNFNQQFEGAIRNSGLINRSKPVKDLNEEDRKTYSDLQQAAARQVEEFEIENKRKATPSERQGIIDKAVLRSVFVDKPWAIDPKRPAGVPLKEDEQDRVYVPIKDIPGNEKDSIRRIFQSKGQQLTDSKMERFYAAILTKNRRLMNSILGE